MSAADAAIVIVGAGQAGVDCAFALRAAGHRGPLTILGDDPRLPYQRPPLSKDYLQSGGASGLLPLRAGVLFDQAGILLRSGVTVTAIDRPGRRVILSQGAPLTWDRLVLATGSRNRLPPVPGLDRAGLPVLQQRDAADTDRMIATLTGASHLAVLGAGFIGLEAAAALARRLRVTVIETAPRVMARAVSGAVSAWFHDHHAALGTDLRLSAGLARIEGGALHLSCGTVLRPDALLVAAGVAPRDGLAAAAGLSVAGPQAGGGIVTDARHVTSDPAILAIGDCACAPTPWGPGAWRIESVANATDQARRAAAVLLDIPPPDPAVPWFWSVQGKARLQIAGLALPGDEAQVTDADADSLIVQRHRAGRLIAVETVNAPRAHIDARRSLRPGP